jgi:hypothetical protein
MQRNNTPSFAYAFLIQWHLLCSKLDVGNLPHQASWKTHRCWRGKTWKSKSCHNFYQGRSTPGHWYESGTIFSSTLYSTRQPVILSSSCWRRPNQANNVGLCKPQVLGLTSHHGLCKPQVLGLTSHHLDPSTISIFVVTSDTAKCTLVDIVQTHLKAVSLSNCITKSCSFAGPNTPKVMFRCWHEWPSLKLWHLSLEPHAFGSDANNMLAVKRNNNNLHCGRAGQYMHGETP